VTRTLKRVKTRRSNGGQNYNLMLLNAEESWAYLQIIGGRKGGTGGDEGQLSYSNPDSVATGGKAKFSKKG